MSVTPQPPRNTRREPHLLRFRLRQMLGFIALCSVLLTLMVTTSGPGPLVIGVAALLIAAHVAGNLIGTRLRDTSNEIRDWRAEQHGTDNDLPIIGDSRAQLAQVKLVAQTPLAGFEQTCRWVTGIVTVGTICGALLGGAALGLALGSRIGWAGWAVGTLSCGVLGAWAAFLASSFSSIARDAWQNAHEKDP